MTAERYALSFNVTQNRWYIYRRGTDDIVAGPFKTREDAIKRLDTLERADR